MSGLGGLVSKSRRNLQRSELGSRSLQRLRGQVSIMLAMMMVTFILFFAFVVNTGMLVNAKINLQNAADLAAYSGAAVQARQLNHISYLNYEMRRAWKKFLFRYYVVGNLAQKTHPTQPGTGPRRWIPDPADPNSKDYKVPAVCVVFNSRDNFCQLTKLPTISIPSPSALDSISNTLRGQLLQIESIRTKNCELIGATNLQLLYYWLWNTDPYMTALEREINSTRYPAATTTVLQILRGLSSGLGVIPRELLTRKRIETLEYYVNFPGQTLNKGLVSTLQNQGDVAARERSIQAFLSAYNTLGTHTFPDDTANITLQELVPTRPKPLLKLDTIAVDGFDAYAVDLKTTTNPNTPTDCQPVVTPLKQDVSVPVGVRKDPRILTYYAVRLEASAKIMFSPFGDVPLRAYAAAQPFGSRIGPNLTSADFLRPATGLNCGVGGFECKGFVPNLPVKEADGTGDGQGWDTLEVIHAMYTKFAPETGGNGNVAASINPSLGVTELERAYQASMAPNPWEQGKYNIPNDLGEDPFVKFFDSPDRTYAFWAPLVSPDQTTNVEQEIQGLIQDLATGNNPGGTGAGARTLRPDLSAALKQALSDYLTKLRNGQGENGEGFFVAKIVDPLTTRPAANGAPPLPITNPPDILMNDIQKIKTSWNRPNDALLRLGGGNQNTPVGRNGYSVKFVSFKTLLGKANVSADSSAGTTWDNDVPQDAQGALDLDANGPLQH